MNNESGLISWHIGVDLAKESDLTAICTIRKIRPMNERSQLIDCEPKLEVLNIKTFPTKPSYVQLKAEIVERLNHAPFSSYTYQNRRLVPVTLTIDRTGLGNVFADMLRADDWLMRRLEAFHAVSLTSGRDVNADGDAVNLPKAELVLQALVSFEQNNLKFAGNMKELPALIFELQNFEMRHTAHGNQTFNAKSGKHDDRVIALALAVWSARNTDEMTLEDEQNLRRAFGHWTENQHGWNGRRY